MIDKIIQKISLTNGRKVNFVFGKTCFLGTDVWLCKLKAFKNTSEF